jgi:hypothetical protein
MKNLYPLSIAVLILIGACATVTEPAQWIRVGITTRAEVIEQYGEPDLVIASQEGETAIYRPRTSGQSAPRMEIPTAQAGPLGSSTTRMQPIEPGLGARATNAGAQDRPKKEIQIRYDAHGIVQALTQ